MTNFLKGLLAAFISTLLLLVLLELIFRFVGAPGASTFAEEVVAREHLSRTKPAGEFRIFTYGESTMHGSQYAPVSSPARWLALYLHDFLPDQKIKVINFARLGKGSDFTYQVFRDTLIYKPDLAIFYLGHNEFFPVNRKDKVIAKRKKLSSQIREVIRHSYFFSTVYRWILRMRIQSEGVSDEDKIEQEIVETPVPPLDPSFFTPRNTSLYSENVEFFKTNILKTIKLAEKNHVPVLFFKPVANLKDFAPWHSMHLVNLSQEGLARWDQYDEEGMDLQAKGDWSGALASYEQAYAIDPTYADLAFRMGEVYFKQGDLVKAKEFFERARDYDVMPVRAQKEIIEVLDALQTENQIPVLDTEKIVISEIPGGILGEPLVEDNVHFSIRGHALLGRAMASEIAERGWMAPKEEWKWGSERPYEELIREVGVTNDFLVSSFHKMIHYFGRRFENRIRLAEKALALDPKNARSLRHLAWTYWLKGDKDKALAVYQQLRETDPNAFREAQSRVPSPVA